MHAQPIEGRFTATCESLGFEPPPHEVRVKILAAQENGTVFVHLTGEGSLGAVFDWVLAMGPSTITVGSSRVLRLECAPLPREWRARFKGLDVPMLHLKPDGSATVAVVGPRGAVQGFASRLRETSDEVLVQHVAPARSPNALLTASQEEALRAAVAAGYYRIPRPLNLHQLAAMADVTAASLSERLRRAEGRVLTQYVELGCPPLEGAPNDKT